MVTYRIRVQSFCDSDGDGVGDYPGLQGKLDYLQGLGVEMLDLMPSGPGTGFEPLAADALSRGFVLGTSTRVQSSPSPLVGPVFAALEQGTAVPLAVALDKALDGDSLAVGQLSTCPPASALGSTDGSRRRLAPRLGGDRARIELAFSLLLTLPGSPVILYGDEIGLGDYPLEHGGHGVYAPMQWSVARNAGFSGAPDDRLERPLIADPAYHYLALNVRRQQDERDSLLKVVSRMVGHRKDQKALHDGTCAVMPSGNPHVLAFVRKTESSTILAIHNLSRTEEEAELDLSPCAGARATDVFKFEAFGPLPAGPAPLRLPPSGYFWFRLQNPLRA